MKLYWYRGLEDEYVPNNITHIFVEGSVTTIKKYVFEHHYHLVFIAMGDNVKTIEDGAFSYCTSLKIVRLSKKLQHIGRGAFQVCRSLEVLILPSTVREIQNEAFVNCWALRLLILPKSIRLKHIGKAIIHEAEIHKIAEAVSGVEYEWTYCVTDESNCRVNKWLTCHMDKSPLHKLCYSTDISATQINEYLSKNGNDSAGQLEPIHRMTPLHMLAMNPHAPAEIIAGTLFRANMGVIFRTDNQGNTPLDYAGKYNVPGLLKLVEALCLHRRSNSAASKSNVRLLDQVEEIIG